MNSEQVVETTIFEYPAAVVRVATQAELRQLALTRAVLDEEALEKYQPYFWSAEISNNRLDSHFTRMAPSSLKNYAGDADAGVSFLYSHDNGEIVGHSMRGQFINAQGNGVARVVADFYAVPGLTLGTVSSDQIIRGIDSKILRYVSVGFYGGEWICSICGRDMWADWDCWHIPSIKFEVEGEGKVTEVVCTADIENAHLAEASGVYKGSTPGAVITKANQEAERGRIRPETRQLIESRYRIHLPEKRVVVPGATMTQEARMGQRTEAATPGASTGASAGTSTAPATTPTDQPGTTPETPAADAAAPAADGATGAPPATDGGAPPAPATDGGADGGAGGDAGGEGGADGRAPQTIDTRALLAMVRGLNHPTLLRDVQALVSENERLRPLADDGRQYRTDLIEEALREGVRAHGAANFKQETYRALMNGAELATVKTMRDDWQREGNKKFPGGRQTVEETAEETSSEPEPEIPDAAFKTR